MTSEKFRKSSRWAYRAFSIVVSLFWFFWKLFEFSHFCWISVLSKFFQNFPKLVPESIEKPLGWLTQFSLFVLILLKKFALSSHSHWPQMTGRTFQRISSRKLRKSKQVSFLMFSSFNYRSLCPLKTFVFIFTKQLVAETHFAFVLTAYVCVCVPWTISFHCVTWNCCTLLVCPLYYG